MPIEGPQTSTLPQILWRISSPAVRIHEHSSFCTEYVWSALASSRWLECTATRVLLCPSWKRAYGPFICILNYSSCDCTSLALVKWGAKCVKNSHEGISLAWREKEREKGGKKAGRQVEATPVPLAPCGEAETVSASKRGVKRKDQTTRLADLHQSAPYYSISQRPAEPAASIHTEEPDVATLILISMLYINTLDLTFWRFRNSLTLMDKKNTDTGSINVNMNCSSQPILL